MVCVISSKHSAESAGHTGLTSIDMLCQDASKSLCPSSRLDIPAFPLQGKSFKKGVRFSVQTTSLGNVPCKRCKFGNIDSECAPAGANDITGRIVRVESIKLRDAQKRPDNALVKISHRLSALIFVSIAI